MRLYYLLYDRVDFLDGDGACPVAGDRATFEVSAPLLDAFVDGGVLEHVISVADAFGGEQVNGRVDGGGALCLSCVGGAVDIVLEAELEGVDVRLEGRIRRVGFRPGNVDPDHALVPELQTELGDILRNHRQGHNAAENGAHLDRGPPTLRLRTRRVDDAHDVAGLEVFIRIILDERIFVLTVLFCCT